MCTIQFYITILSYINLYYSVIMLNHALRSTRELYSRTVFRHFFFFRSKITRALFFLYSIYLNPFEIVIKFVLQHILQLIFDQLLKSILRFLSTKNHALRSRQFLKRKKNGVQKREMHLSGSSGSS